ncbi:MAG: TetR/AcrR family transcriptional regulator [Deltaproteobacteria bacterium]|nr:TetR/AcrR family transcriptional regulator [Deltaproteobacteria bacterium]
MGVSPRLSADQRRAAIVQAATKVFADNGFHGTTTRELARAAGVSEALLYKHFPSKESLFGAMLANGAKGAMFTAFKRILALEPSTSTLVIMVHFMISYYVRGGIDEPGTSALNILQVRSLLADGDFVRIRHKKFARTWIAKFDQCLKQAAEKGELREIPIRRDLRVWFVQHIAFSLMLNLHPKVPAIDYDANLETLIEQATWFALLGVGMDEAAIRGYYDPKVLAPLTS